MIKKIIMLILLLLTISSCSQKPKTFSLQERLNEQAEKSKIRVNDASRKIMQEATLALSKTEIMKNFLFVGDKAPNFLLDDVNGVPVSLYEELEKGPVVLSFYRGSWCPYCNIELVALQEYLPRIKSSGASLIAISPELPENGRELIQKNMLDYLVLSDVGNQVSRRYNLVFKLPSNLVEVYDSFGIDLIKSNGDNSYELPVPATYVIGTNKVIKYAFTNIDYRKRAEPEDIVKVLQSLK